MKTLPEAWTDKHTNATRGALFLAGEIMRKRLNDAAQQRERGVNNWPAEQATIAELASMDAARELLLSVLEK